jgi:hypothetical protein
MGAEPPCIAVSEKNGSERCEAVAFASAGATPTIDGSAEGVDLELSFTEKDPLVS